MLSSEACQKLLLDYVYGLLDAEEVAAVEACLAECPECRAALEQARRQQSLLSRAAKSAFPEVTFTPPAATHSSVTIPAMASASETRPAAPSTTPTVPVPLVTSDASPDSPPSPEHRTRLTAGEPSRRTDSRGRPWLNFLIAASLLLAVTGIAGPVAQDLVGYYQHKPHVDQELAALREEEARRKQLEQAIESAIRETEQKLITAQQQHDRLLADWVKAEETLVSTTAAQPFLIDIQGPATAIPGAPNVYTLTVHDKAGKPVPTTVTAEVQDDSGKVYFTQELKTTANEASRSLKLPAELWAKIPPRADLRLSIKAVDPASGKRSSIVEELRLQAPVFATFLSTDKPMYQPGEVVYFRSLTLDRTRFLPPESELNLRFELRAPSGQPVPGLELVGLAKPVGPDGRLVRGPDGKPIRGVGTGAFTLPRDLPGGEYTLFVYEVPLNQTQPAPEAKPLARRKILVNEYTPDRLLKTLEFDGKSYGPGDVVQAKFTVADQGQPLANARLKISVEANGREIPLSAAPSATTSSGTAAIRFTLPQHELRDARLSVTVTTNGIVETIVRPIPLVTRQLFVEFFPEGGDLIAGVPNRVYFRVTNTNGKPADLEGTLTDGFHELTTVKTLTDPEHPGANQGLGVFEFTPRLGQNYVVRLKSPLSVVPPCSTPSSPPAAALLGNVALQTGYPLPQAKSEGIALTVLDTVSQPGQPIRLRLAQPPSIAPGASPRPLLVGAYIRSQPVAHARVTLAPGQSTELALDPGATPLGGVTRITVFEEPEAVTEGRTDLKPVAERLVFRQPGHSLKLSASITRANGSQPKAFVPGDSLRMQITSTTESQTPTPAILWASVVNKSVITMADDKTDRLMPTHFLLNGEVRHPEELEHADFLLTDQPNAARTLDLLLGTQGWRRFAEQAPGEFRKRVPADDAEQLLLAMGASGPVPSGWRNDIRRVFDDYWPRYEAALLDLETAQTNQQTQPLANRLHQDLLKVNEQYQAQILGFARVAIDLDKYYQSLLERQRLLPQLLLGLLLPTLGLLLLRRRYIPGSSEYRSLTAAVAGLIFLAGFLTLSTSVASFSNADWQQTLQQASRTHELASALPSSPTETFHHLALPSDTAPGAELRARKASEGKPAPAAAEIPEALPPRAIAAADQEKPDIHSDAGKAGNPKRGIDPTAPAAAGHRAEIAAKIQGPGLPRHQSAAREFGNSKANRAQLAFNQSGLQLDRKEKQRQDQAKQWREEQQKSQARHQIGLSRRLAVENLRQLQNQRFLQLQQHRFENDSPDDQANQAALSAFDRIANQMPGVGEQPQQLAGQIPQSPPLLVREYAHQRPNSSPESTALREDFAETLLWQPVLVTPSDGRITLEFALSDAVAPYQVLIAGHTLDGRIGATTTLIEVRKPFAIDPKMPPEVSSTDVLDVPVLVTNATEHPLLAQFTVDSGKFTLVDQPAERSRIVEGNSGSREIVRLAPNQSRGELAVTIHGVAGLGVQDSIRRTVRVVSDGFPYHGSYTDTLEQTTRVPITLPADRLPGSTSVTVTIYPNTLAELQAGLDGLLREPHGCFEQSSTANYPNVLISEYLRETNQAEPEVSRRARDLLDRGYARLVGFECPKTGVDGRLGFEWFGGKDRQHEALTAYGLLQFTDMSRVYPVDPALLKRTKEYLLSCRDGRGGFTRNPRAIDSFGGAPDTITNAYIVWAITEAERGDPTPSDLTRELDALIHQANEKASASDPYFLSLVANALLNRHRRPEALQLLTSVARMQAKDGSIPGASTSITRSAGRALLIETTALAVLGFLKAERNDLFFAPMHAAIRWIGQQRGGQGTFGSTQSTILALKALIEHARASKKPAESAELEVVIAGQKLGTKAFRSDDSGPIVYDIPEPDKHFPGVSGDIEVRSTAKQSYPVTVAWSCQTRTPNSSPECPIRLETRLAQPHCLEGDTIRLDLAVENRAEQSQGMVVAIVGLPAGLKLPEDRKQLKQLIEQPVDGSEPIVSYWETRGRELILYWRGMKPKQQLSFALDLIADIPGEYTAPASRAYLYYNADHKYWVAPSRIAIQPRR